MTHAIESEGLAKRFGETVALAGVDLHVPTGSVLGLLGPNGAGKTTAVRIFATLLLPDAGRAQVGGFDVVADAHRVRSIIGLTGQYASVDEKLTGWENLVLLGRLLDLPRAEARCRARDLLAQFQLEEASGRAVATYSGGMRRRLDLAASLVGRPPILFLDEPTTGLDPRGRLELWALIRQLVSEGTTVLLTTQYLDEADQLADSIAVIDEGRLIARGSPEELKARLGAQSLLVRPARSEDIGATLSILKEVTGAEPQAEDSTVTAAVSDPGLLTAAVCRLEEAGITIAELELRRPTLDEVFLALTSRVPERTPGDHEEEGCP